MGKQSLIATLVLATVVSAAPPQSASAGGWKEYLQICFRMDKGTISVVSKSGDTKPNVGGPKKTSVKYIWLINEYIGDGWQPLGGPVVVATREFGLSCQAMVRG